MIAEEERIQEESVRAPPIAAEIGVVDKENHGPTAETCPP